MYARQIKTPDPLLRRQLQFHPYFLKKLRHVGTISEHTGCVSRLCWSEDGKLLASCSHDLHICLWNMDWNMTAPCSIIKTHHLDHIFGIKFIPLRENKIIVTGGTDAAVEVHTLADDLRSRINSNLLYCHKAAINYIEVEPSSPNLFFSVGDDSCVRQYDLRIKMMGCQSEESVTGKTGSMYRSSNCLLRCKDKMGINSMKIDRVNTNMFVLATSENRVSVYDRRVLNLTVPTSDYNTSNRSSPIASFCPEHLLEKPGCYSSYAEFSPCGRHVLASFHSDHAYVFPLYDVRNGSGNSFVCSGADAAPLPWRIRSSEARSLRDKVKEAKDALDIGLKTIDIGLNTTSYNMFTRAIDISLQAIALRDARISLNLFPVSSADLELHDKATQIYVDALTNRAGVCEKRRFAGDDNAGLADLQCALRLQPNDIEVLIKKTKFLLNLNRPEEALSILDKIAGLRHIDNNQLIYIQNDIDMLRAKADFAVIDKMRMQNQLSNQISIPVDMEEQSEYDLQKIYFSHKRRHSDEPSTAIEGCNDHLSLEEQSESTALSKRAKPNGELSGNDSAVTVFNSTSAPPMNPQPTERLVTSYSQRFIGASNISTNLMECVFVGANGEYCAGGSDDGRFFIWDRFSGEILLCRLADPDVLSCLQPHPTFPIIATCGLDDSVRLWGPSSTKHLFKRLNTNDPFKSQCGKLELPELSRMRPRSSHPPPEDIAIPIPSVLLTSLRAPSLANSSAAPVASKRSSYPEHFQEEDTGENIDIQYGGYDDANNGNTTRQGIRPVAHEYCDANGASDMGSISLTSSGRSLMCRAEQGSYASSSSFSCTQSDSSSGSSDYGPALDDGSSESNDGDSTIGGTESRKVVATDSANTQSKLTHAVLAAQEVERAVNLKEDELIKNTVNILSSSQKRESYGDAENGSRDSQSNQGSRSGSGNGSDSNEEGQTAGDRTGSGSNSSTEVTEGSLVSAALNGTKTSNYQKAFAGDTSSSDGGSKVNDRVDQHGLSSDLTSGSSSGSGGENSSTRSSPNRAPRLATTQNNSNNSISSNSNNNSDKNSDTYVERTEVQFWNLSDRSMQPMTSLISNIDSTEISLSSNNGKKAKKSESRNCKSDTITNSSDSGSALLKLSALPDVDSKKEPASSSSVSLTVYRKALQQAVEGLPIDADEALALEEIIAENQLLAKNNPSPLFYRQLSMNSSMPIGTIGAAPLQPPSFISDHATLLPPNQIAEVTANSARTLPAVDSRIARFPSISDESQNQLNNNCSTS